MCGKVVRQYNNLKITKDVKSQLYRVYAPNGAEVYHSPCYTDAEMYCTRCKTYVQRSPNYYYEIRVRFAPGGTPDDYTVYVKAKQHFQYETEVINYARINGLFDSDDDAKYVAYANEISASEYKYANAS